MIECLKGDGEEIDEKLKEIYEKFKIINNDYDILKEYKDSIDMVERYPLFVKEKKISFLNVMVSTVIYNGLVMLGFIFSVGGLALVMLRFEKRGIVILSTVISVFVLMYLAALFW